MDERAYQAYILRANKAQILREIVVAIIAEDHPNFSVRECILFARLHKIITADEFNLLNEFYK